MNTSDEYDNEMGPTVLAPETQWVSYDDLSDAARTDACVLFTGRKDTVERVAYLVHTLSGWRDGPFITADCGRELDIESLVFEPSEDIEVTRPDRAPHARLAQAGSVLLREIGRLSAPVQTRIADILDGTLGGDARARMRRRLMASTSEPLLPRVLDGTFDDRLFYRLNVIHLVLPNDTRGGLPRPLPPYRKAHYRTAGSGE